MNWLSSIYQRIKTNLYDWYISATDICQEIGLDVAAFKREYYYANKIKDLFENDVEIVCYIIHSKYPGVYGFPGHKIMSNPYILKIKHLPDWLLPGVLTIVDKCLKYIGVFEKAARGTLIINKQNQLHYNPTTGKFRIPVDFHCIYITTKALEILTEREILAMAVYVCGLSEFMFYDSVIDTLHYVDNGTFLFFYGYLGLNVYNVYNKKVTLLDSLNNIIFWLSALALSTIILKSLVIYYDKMLHILADEFPIKCGFGKDYLSLRKKLHKYMYDVRISKEQSNLHSNTNILDRMLRSYRAIILHIEDIMTRFGLKGRIDKETREQMIANKIKLYEPNIKNQLVDRSNSIDLTMEPTPNPFVNAIDAIHNKVVDIAYKK